MNQIKSRKDISTANKEFMSEKLGKIEAEQEELTLQASNVDKKILKLQVEKKKFADQKKFKDASKAQNEIKDFQQNLETM